MSNTTDHQAETSVASETDSKRSVSPEPDENEPESKRLCQSEILDLAETFGYKPGDRFEVQWETEKDGEMIVHWWPCSLKEHDGLSTDSVAIRILDYDPFPEGGFPEHSEEGVIFMGRNTLVNPENSDEMTYRRAGETGDASTVEETEEMIHLNRENVEEVVNATLEVALKKNSEAWSRLPPAKQASIAAAVAGKKAKLVELLLNHPNKVITSKDMQSILSQTMQAEKK